MKGTSVEIDGKILEYLEKYAQEEGLGLSDYVDRILKDHLRLVLEGDRHRIKDEIYEESLRKIGLSEDEIENIVYGGR